MQKRRLIKRKMNEFSFHTNSLAILLIFQFICIKVLKGSIMFFDRSKPLPSIRTLIVVITLNVPYSTHFLSIIFHPWLQRSSPTQWIINYKKNPPSSLPAQAAAVLFVASGPKIRLNGRRNKHQTVVVVNMRQVLVRNHLPFVTSLWGCFPWSMF